VSDLKTMGKSALAALNSLANPEPPRPAPSGVAIRRRRDGRYDVLEPLPGDGGSASQQYDVDEKEAERLWNAGARRVPDSDFAAAGGVDTESAARVRADEDGELVLGLVNGEPTQMSRASARAQGVTPLATSPAEYSAMQARSEADSVPDSVAMDFRMGDAVRAAGPRPVPPGVARDFAMGDAARARGGVPASVEADFRAGDAALAARRAAAPQPAAKPRAASPRLSVGMPSAGPAPRVLNPLAGAAPSDVPSPTVDQIRFSSRGEAVSQPPPGDPELDAALEQARDLRLISGIGGIGARLGGLFTGRGDTSHFDAQRADSDRPVRELGMRRESALRQRAEAKDAARRDPTSPESQRLQLAVSKALPGVYSPEELSQLTAADEESVMKFGAMSASLKQRAQEAAARAEEARAGRDFESQEAEKQRAFQAGENAKNRAVDRARIGAGIGPGGAGARVPAGEATALGEADSAVRALEALEASRGQKTGWASGVTQFLPGTDASQYVDDTRSAAQIVGRFLEGGKMTDADVPRYQASLRRGLGRARVQQGGQPPPADFRPARRPSGGPHCRRLPDAGVRAGGAGRRSGEGAHYQRYGNV
jgi:hypothetical protein